MLHELFTYAVAQCPAFAREMGYLYEEIALKARFGRLHSSWQAHLRKTRQFVLSGASRCRGRDKVIILGSGILLDVPLEELSAMFREVVLIDVVFLPAVRRSIQAYGNVLMLELDVTKTAESLHQGMRRGRASLPEILPSFPDIMGESSLVVSLNLLSQLPVIPETYIMRKMPWIAEAQVDAWCSEIISSHYQALCALPCNVCLVTDYRYAKRDPGGNIMETGDTLRGITLPAPDDEWTWDIAPLGEYSRRFSKELTVGGWHVR